MAKVLVALSGGVDSAVAAAVLTEQGHDVVGVHLKLAELPGTDQIAGQGCCTLDDAQDARRTAQQLDIPFYVWDLSDLFLAEVQEPFVERWHQGLTPNPCITCNEKVKYAGLLARATSLGFDALATGHHVRLRRGGTFGDGSSVESLVRVGEPGEGVRMFRAADPAKDQSYVLHMAGPEQLAHTLFPVGEWDKTEVRAMAASRGLARVAAKPDSYEICFVPDGDTAGWLDRHLEPEPGPIIDVDGNVVGSHEGTWHVTVGQRRGLGLSGHQSRFVVDVDAASNTVVVAARSLLACNWLRLDGMVWTSGAPFEGEGLSVQVRAHGAPVPCSLDGDRLVLDEPLHGVALGQAAALYVGDECLGGATIVEAERPAWQAGS